MSKATFVFFPAVFLVTAAISAAAPAWAQDYPKRPVRFVTTEAGGGNDFAARIVAQGLAPGLGQPVVVENRGGTVVIPVGIVTGSLADGHTLLFHGNPVWFLPLMQEGLPFQPLRDLTPITLIDISPLVLTVNPAVPARTTEELIALARAKPSAMNYASGISGSTPHLAAELLKSMADIRIERVSYKGVGPALLDVLAGRVQIMFVTPAAGLPHVRSGKLTALAVTSAKPSELVPNLPTMASSGLPGYECTNIHGLFAPVKTPRPVVARLHQETARVLGQPAIRERFLAAGVEPVGSTPAEFASVIKSDTVVWRKVIKQAGIRVE